MMAGDLEAASLLGAQGGTGDVHHCLPAQCSGGEGGQGHAAGSGEADSILLRRTNSSGRERCRGHQLTRGPQPRGAALAGPCPEPRLGGSSSLPLPGAACRHLGNCLWLGAGPVGQGRAQECDLGSSEGSWGTPSLCQLSVLVNAFTTCTNHTASREEVEKKSVSYILRLCLLPFTTLLLPVRSIELRKTTTTNSPSCIVTLQRCSSSVAGWSEEPAPQLGVSLLPLKRLRLDQS